MPAELVDEERAEHEHLVEDVVEQDDELLEQYLEGNEPTTEQLEKALHEAVDEARVFPVLCRSAITPIGIGKEALEGFNSLPHQYGPAVGHR